MDTTIQSQQSMEQAMVYQANNQMAAQINKDIQNYHEQLMQIAYQQQLAALNTVKFDVPPNWMNEQTTLKYSDSFFCIGQDQLFTETGMFGRIEFIRNTGCCFIDCSFCKNCCEEHFERAFYFTNIPNQRCPIQIEMCCYKTQLIRYKGIAIGRIERLISGICSTSNRVIIKPINNQRTPIILAPRCSLQYCMRKNPSKYCKYPIHIDIIRNGNSISEITNTHYEEPKCCCCSFLCNCPWDLKHATYSQGFINFTSDMTDDEKILVVCGWIIEQAFMTNIL
ncbi:hypothetical protein ABPG74_009474 [Tetrahymena malaccensis]